MKKRCPRILLADDFPQILEKVEKLLRNDYEIVGFARHGGEALELCLTLKPDILLLDLSMPILCGFEVATHLKELGCRSKIVILTAQEDRDYAETAFSLGASAYVLKCRIGDDLLSAIDAALNGTIFTSPFHAGSTAPERV
jgi:DNA-binding NarL/FixJ family response regulator